MTVRVTACRHGSLSEQVVALEVVSGDGEARWYTEEDGHLFRALKVSVGRLGIITRLRWDERVAM